MKSSAFNLIFQIVLVGLIGSFLVNAVPVQEIEEEGLTRIVRQAMDGTTYKYQNEIAAYTFSPFGPRPSPTTTTTTTPVPVTTTKRPWYKFW